MHSKCSEELAADSCNKKGNNMFMFMDDHAKVYLRQGLFYTQNSE